MIVTIFETLPNENRRMLLEKLFRQYVFPGAIVKSEHPKDAVRYIKLLQAAVPPEKGISLSVEDFDISSYRLYLKAYFSIRNSYGSNSRSFQADGALSFFPAVAVHDRMVFVPLGLANHLVGDNYRSFMPPFSALKEGGVLELDYDDERAVTSAMRSVADLLRREFIRNFQAYSEIENVAGIDLQQIADDLNTDIEYVRYLLKGQTRPFDDYLKVNVGLVPASGPVSTWTKATLKLENNSDYDLTNVLVRFKGPVSVLPEPLETSIPAHSATEVTISIKPQNPGPFPIEISCLLPEHQRLAKLIRGRDVWFESLN